MRGPVNVPSRKDPPIRASARARNASGARVVMNACRASAKTDAHVPMSRAPRPSTAMLGASSMTAMPTSEIPAATIIAARSPKRAMKTPAGRFPHS